MRAPKSKLFQETEIPTFGRVEEWQRALGSDFNDLLLKSAEKCKGSEKAPVGSPRQKSFCGRMCGMKKKNTGTKKKKDPDSCLNQSLRRWKCRCD